MNVITYLIEVSRFPFTKTPISKLILDKLEKELDTPGDYNETIKCQWDNIEYDEIKSIFSPEILIGTSTIQGVTIFLFRNSNNIARGKQNITIDVIAYGDLEVDEIINRSFRKIRRILWMLIVRYVRKSKVAIYPFDSQKGDIYTYELKVNSELVKPATNSYKDYIRWTLLFLFSGICCILYFLPVENNDSSGLVMKNLYGSVSGSAIVYLIVDFIFQTVANWISNCHKKKVIVKNLSSIIDSKNPFIKNQGTNPSPLEIPKTEQ